LWAERPAAQSRTINSQLLEDSLESQALNGLIVLLGLESLKPVLTALVLPPVPLLVLLLFGARLLLPRRGWGWLVILTSVALLWLTACAGTARLLSQFVLHPPAALTADRIKALKTLPRPPTAIVILAGGMEPFAPEYGVSNLTHSSLERLRFGVWLSRQTGLPLAFSGGVGWGQPDAKPEARIAAQIAVTEFNMPLKWIEDESRDTRQNASYSVALMRAAGIKHIVLVTHGWHMPRALQAFESAARGEISIEAAPMGLSQGGELPILRWIPSSSGATDVRQILRELLGRVAGA
jgi:uncharacterized SAM-binding protein YcdF (DUF218 family)